MNVPKLVIKGAIAAAIGLTVLSGFYVVPEGHVGVVKQFAKAQSQSDPGLNFKIPFIETVESIEVRQKKNVETLAAATANQLPITATVSVNWTVHKDAAKDLFIKYGGLSQFEERVLDPKLRSASKAALSKFRADELIRDRNKAVAAIMVELVKVTEGLPISIDSPQLEDVVLPPTYMAAILAKEEAREGGVREKHNLEKQRLESLERVNTAEADKQSRVLEADGIAYRVLTEAKAEAEAISLINAQLSDAPHYVELVKAKAWDGKLPVTMMSGQGGSSILLGLGATGK
jgi:regulator of protease activity HflC (stomatin/prohibitin superfamily)